MANSERFRLSMGSELLGPPEPPLISSDRLPEQDNLWLP
jgi:hypothetical protein